MNLLCSCVLYISVLIFYPFTQICIIGHKWLANFPEVRKKILLQSAFFFQLQKCSIEIFL